MSTQAPAATRADWCSMCRRGSCPLCSSPTCACTTGAAHPNRPRSGARPTPIRTEAPKATPPPTSQGPGRITSPKWGPLVKGDPPAPPRKPARVTVVDQARPFVEQLVADGTHDWHLIAHQSGLYVRLRGDS